MATNQPHFNPIEKANLAQKGECPSLIESANIRTVINDPNHGLVRINQPPEHTDDKIAFTFNNLSLSNLCSNFYFFFETQKNVSLFHNF
ncbi:unnamed protein product [Rotaria sp. Silwood2]|nr:unnamed protein product [Rotaria sp. Silwood2]CAF4407584.1 unnamed protein product [Rotaria sp. Silwood2]